MAEKSVSIKERCRTCTGHGVIGVRTGVGRICYACHGAGFEIYTYTVFEKRRVRDDLKKIELIRYKMVKGKATEIKKYIPYERFLEIAKKRDAKARRVSV